MVKSKNRNEHKNDFSTFIVLFHFIVRISVLLRANFASRRRASARATGAWRGAWRDILETVARDAARGATFLKELNAPSIFGINFFVKVKKCKEKEI